MRIKQLIAIASMAFIVAPLNVAVAAAKTEHRVSYDEAQRLIEAELVNAGAGDAVSAALSNVAGSYLYQGAAPVTLGVGYLNYDERTQRFEAELQLSEAGRLVKSHSMVGRYSSMLNVPVLSRRLFSGDVISEADVTEKRMPLQRLRHNTIQDRAKLLGMSARRALREGHPVAAHEIEAPIIVERGDLLRLSYRTPHMHIETVVESLEKAPVGKLISVRNVDSGNVLRAKIVAPGIAQTQSQLLVSRNEYSY